MIEQYPADDTDADESGPNEQPTSSESYLVTSLIARILGLFVDDANRARLWTYLSSLVRSSYLVASAIRSFDFRTRRIV